MRACSTSCIASRMKSKSPPARNASSRSVRADWSKAIVSISFVNPARNTLKITRWPPSRVDPRKPAPQIAGELLDDIGWSGRYGLRALKSHHFTGHSLQSPRDRQPTDPTTRTNHPSTHRPNAHTTTVNPNHQLSNHQLLQPADTCDV